MQKSSKFLGKSSDDLEKKREKITKKIKTTKKKNTLLQI